MPKKFKTIIKLLISATLLALIYTKIDLSNLLSKFEAISLSTVVLLISIYTFGQILSALKWSLLLKSINLNKTNQEVVRAYFLGMFVNNFGLGTLGGDVARSLALNPPKGKRAACMATVIADRVHGLAVLISIGTIGLLFNHPKALGSFAAPLSAVLIVSIIGGWIFGPKLLTRIFPETSKFGKTASEVKKAFPKNRSTILSATFLSACCHLLQITMVYLISNDLNTGLTFSFLAACVPFVNAAATMPISILNGLGVREAGYIFFLSSENIPTEVSVAFGAIWAIVAMLVSAIGGFFVAPKIADDAMEAPISPEQGEEKIINGGI